MDIEPSLEPDPHAPTLRGEVAKELGHAASVAAEAVVATAVRDVVLPVAAVAMLIVFVPVGLFVLLVSFGTLYAVYLVIGTQPGILGTVIGGTWLVLTFVAMFLAFRAVLQRLPFRARTVSTRRVPVDHFATKRDEARTRPPTLAELDASLAPGTPGESP